MVDPARLPGKEWRLPFGLSVSFVTVIQTLSLSAFIPVPLALLAGVGWGVAISLLAVWLRNRVKLSTWLEDVLVVLGTMAMAYFGFGGFAAILLFNGALDSPSLTGQTLVLMFLPSLLATIIPNMLMELFIIPGLLIIGWREGKRRVLIAGAVALFLIHRIWTYVVFVSNRLDFAEMEHSTTPLTAAERQDLHAALHLEDDPRWVLNLVIFMVLLLAAHLPRVREAKTAAGQRPVVARG